jgi:hypothetical protein
MKKIDERCYTKFAARHSSAVAQNDLAKFNKRITVVKWLVAMIAFSAILTGVGIYINTHGDSMNVGVLEHIAYHYTPLPLLAVFSFIIATTLWWCVKVLNEDVEIERNTWFALRHDRRTFKKFFGTRPLWDYDGESVVVKKLKRRAAAIVKARGKEKERRLSDTFYDAVEAADLFFAKPRYHDLFPKEGK